MTMSSLDRRHRKYAPFFDVDPVTGRSIEVFYADRTLETYGKSGAGWFWNERRSGFAPDGPAIGPFPTSYSAFRNALLAKAPGRAADWLDDRNFDSPLKPGSLHAHA